MPKATNIDQKRVLVALNQALKWVQENYTQILYPLNKLSNPPDLYVSTIKVLLSSELVSSREALRILRFLLKVQREDGSWPEIMAFRPWQEKSVVFTSSVGCQLFGITNLFQSYKEELMMRLQMAADFVVSREIKDGWFRKSEDLSLDTINVDALCALFLIKCYKSYRRRKYLKSSLKGIMRVIRSQKDNGEFLYYADSPPISTLYYHALTTNLLTQFYTEYPSNEIAKSAIKGGIWLLKRQSLSGRFSWKGCTDHWTYRNFVTYPLTLEAWTHLRELDVSFEKPLQRTLKYIMQLQSDVGSFPVKDAQRTLQMISEDFENAAILIHAGSRLLLPSLVRSIRILTYNTEGYFGTLTYWLSNGFRSYIRDKFISTLETTDILLKFLKKQTENMVYKRGLTLDL